ncbi:rfbP protein [Vibrio cholerae]|nr:rfbP protein [Vibrio cholerae]EGR0364558.1 rfbP protein [Vibrio cholerae]EGR0538881.1 rfbP protein [Vibrio cholerae]EGR0937168.1 rfbP protein [Vibrio cholerae]EGR1137262.1 rfbP protein [Vibrio cholerae]
MERYLKHHPCGGVFVVIPKPPLLAVVIVPRGFCPKMRPC